MVVARDGIVLFLTADSTELIEFSGPLQTHETAKTRGFRVRIEYTVLRRRYRG